MRKLKGMPCMFPDSEEEGVFKSAQPTHGAIASIKWYPWISEHATRRTMILSGASSHQMDGVGAVTDATVHVAVIHEKAERKEMPTRPSTRRSYTRKGQ